MIHSKIISFQRTLAVLVRVSGRTIEQNNDNDYPGIVFFVWLTQKLNYETWQNTTHKA